MAAKRTPADPNAAKYLLFIDTNIWLDFYRLEASEKMLGALPLIGHARDRLISTDQVQMEFMKNRQNVLLLALDKFKSSDDARVPPVIADAVAARTMKTAKKAMEDRRKLLKQRVERILLNPARNDPVFRTLQGLFADPTDLVLCRPKDERYAMREMAEKRWKLGYPPRKADDTSIGDAINWEWLLDCAIRRNGYVIIVSRDHDFGRAHNHQSYLNDWLQKEYRERVGSRKKIVLTNALHTGLKLMDVQVPPEVVKAEEELIHELPLVSATAPSVSWLGTATLS